MGDTEDHSRVTEPQVRNDGTAAHRGKDKVVATVVEETAAHRGEEAVSPAPRKSGETRKGSPSDSRRSRGSRTPTKRKTRSRTPTRRTSRSSRTPTRRTSRTPVRRSRHSRSRSRGRSTSVRSTPRHRHRNRSPSERREWRRSSNHHHERSRTRSPEEREEYYEDYDNQYDYEEDYHEDEQEDRRRSRSSSTLSGLSGHEDNEDEESVETNRTKEASPHEESPEETKENKDPEEKKRKSPPRSSSGKEEPKRKRFCAQSEEEKSSVKLKKQEAKYINKALHTHMTNKTAEDSILKTNPVPKNITDPENLDDTWETRLERRHKDTILMDNDLKKVQKNLRNVFGPLTKLWSKVETDVTDKQGKDEMLTSVEQTILLIGKVNNDITYTRRTRVLNKFTRDKKKTVKTLKKYEEILDDTDGVLFGKAFEKRLKKKGKAKKTQHEVLMALNPEGQHRDRPRSSGYRPPFRDGPAHENRERGAGAHNQDRDHPRDSGHQRGSFRGRFSGRRPRRGGRR